MAKSKQSKINDKEVSIVTNTWGENEAREFLLKGGIVTVKVTNYDKSGEVTHYCITEKQIPPNYKLHMNPKKDDEKDEFDNLKDELK